MRLILEDFDEKHIRLLKEMADVLEFRFRKLDNPSFEDLNQNAALETEEKEMNLISMQASEQSLAELWDNEDDDYWNSYL